jgi:hypothetical protein
MSRMVFREEPDVTGEGGVAGDVDSATPDLVEIPVTHPDSGDSGYPQE